MPATIKPTKMLMMIVLCIFISGCVFYPKKIEHYDADCDITFRQLELESKEMKDACAKPRSDDPYGNACLMGVIGMSALSAIVSGSLVVAGNTVYWLEKEGRCLNKTNP